MQSESRKIITGITKQKIMVGVNKVILIGNLGKNPEIISFPKDGRRDDTMNPVVRKATFPLATTEIRKNKDGEKIEQTDWHTVVCWRGLADIAEKYKAAHGKIEKA